MNRGFLLHAYNNSEIDYGQMALCACLLIKKNLHENSTALITSQDTLDFLYKNYNDNLIDHAFDHIILTDINKNVSNRTFHDTRYSKKLAPYYNTNRADSYNLSPFTETMLLDVDYLVLDDSLDKIWGSPDEIMVNKISTNLFHLENLGGFNKRLNDTGIPLYWATAMYFKKSEYTEVLFDLINFIKENYQFYQSLYKFPVSGYFRNDYALSVALHMLNGHVENNTVRSLPINKITVATENDDLIDFVNGTAVFISESNQGDFKLHKFNTNVHILNKWSIGRVAERIIAYATQ